MKIILYLVRFLCLKGIVSYFYGCNGIFIGSFWGLFENLILIDIVSVLGL